MTRVPLVKKLKRKEERGDRAGGVGKGMEINPVAITTSYPSSSVAGDKQELAPTYPPHSGKNWNERTSPLPRRASAVVDAALAIRSSPLAARSHPVVAGIQSSPEMVGSNKPSPPLSSPILPYYCRSQPCRRNQLSTPENYRDSRSFSLFAGFPASFQGSPGCLQPDFGDPRVAQCISYFSGQFPATAPAHCGRNSTGKRSYGARRSRREATSGTIPAKPRPRRPSRHYLEISSITSYNSRSSLASSDRPHRQKEAGNPLS